MTASPATQSTTKALDLPRMWPEIFEGMSTNQVFIVEQTVAASWHEGRTPEYEHTALLAAVVRGDVSHAEYRKRCGLTPAS